MEPLISVLVVSYNNQRYIYECLHSVFSQTYPRMEVLIGDDGSPDFDQRELEKWIEENRTSNVTNIRIFAGENNVGTVANLEHLQQESRGDYLLHIAADDALYDESTLETLYRYGQEHGDPEIVFAQTEMWDERLSQKMGDYVTEETAQTIRTGTPRDLFGLVSHTAALPSVYLYQRQVLDKVGKLSDQYRLVEDIPAQLRLLRQGIRVDYCAEIPVLKHRHGGISHGNSRQSRKALCRYYRDIVKIYPGEVQPFLHLLTQQEQRAAKIEHIKRWGVFFAVRMPILHKLYCKIKQKSGG